MNILLKLAPMLTPMATLDARRSPSVREPRGLIQARRQAGRSAAADGADAPSAPQGHIRRAAREATVLNDPAARNSCARFSRSR
jgi:hypothetical protein